MKLIVPATVFVAAVSAVLTLTSPPATPDVQPVVPGTAVVMAASRATDPSYDREVAPGEAIKVTGRLPKTFARATASLLLGQGGSWRRVDADRVAKDGGYVLKTAAAARAGQYTYRVTARAGGRELSKKLTVKVSAPIPTPAPTPVPTPTSTPAVPPPPAPTGGMGDPNDWTYISDRAARWDPCHPITWSVSGAAPYAEHVTDLTNAFALVGSRSGLTFTRVADPNASVFDVTWGTAAEYPYLSGSTLGFGGPTYTSTPSREYRIVSGQVTLDSEEKLAPGYASAQATWGKVMVHEIIHAVGLGHAQGAEQIMFPMINSNYALGAGDLAGLYAVGSAKGCFPTTPAPRVTAQPHHAIAR